MCAIVFIILAVNIPSQWQHFDEAETASCSVTTLWPHNQYINSVWPSHRVYWVIFRGKIWFHINSSRLLATKLRGWQKPALQFSDYFSLLGFDNQHLREEILQVLQDWLHLLVIWASTDSASNPEVNVPNTQNVHRQHPAHRINCAQTKWQALDSSYQLWNKLSHWKQFSTGV